MLSLLDDALSQGAGIAWLRPARQIVAYSVLLACVAVYGAACLSPRLPKRILLPPAVFLLWWAAGALPLGLLAPDFEHRALLAGAAQLALAALAFGLVRRRSGGWRLGPDPAPPPAFRLRRAALALALHLVLLLPVTAVWLGLSFAENLVRSTGGFVAFDGEGMQMVERRYRSTDREVVLVGMVHVGEPSTYRDLFASFVVKDTVVLQEGVTDLEQRLGVPLSYERVAAATGLEMQPALEEVVAEMEAGGDAVAEEWPHLRHADVDAAAFSAPTIAFLERMGRVIQAEDPLAEVQEFAAFVRAAGPGLWWSVEQDLLVMRNRRAITQLDRALESYERVVIPWGALHMPGIEDGVLARGFERSEERRRLAVPYSTMAQGLRVLWGALSR